jgi:2-phospho-L-lactate guanylyltransferase
VLASVERIAGIVVVSRDLTAHDLARAKRATPLAETEAGLNSAVAQACDWVAARGAAAVLVVPTDLPLLTALDVESMIDLAVEPACIVIAPDRRDSGTNALLVRPPHAIRPAFGAASFEAHCGQAAHSGIAAHVFRSATIALDLDVPDDLRRYNQVAALDALPLYE